MQHLDLNVRSNCFANRQIKVIIVLYNKVQVGLGTDFAYWTKFKSYLVFIPCRKQDLLKTLINTSACVIYDLCVIDLKFAHLSC